MAETIRWQALLLATVLAPGLCAQGNTPGGANSGNAPATPKRIATVVDFSGTRTEVANWHFGGGGGDDRRQRFGLRSSMSSTPLVAVNTTTVEIVIPEDSLISLDSFVLPARAVIAGFPENPRAWTGHEVRYFWAGKMHMVKGRLVSGDLTGESDFGAFDLASDKLKQFRLNPAPAPISKTRACQSLILPSFFLMARRFGPVT